jgi:trk system potassium uptake protein
MRAIIIGAGDIGTPIIHYLSERGHLLAVFDKDEEHCKNVSNESDAAIFCATAELPEIWKKAEAWKADLLMALTNDDEINAKVSQIAKRDFGIPFVIARAHQPENIDKIKEAGADIAICPSQETLRVFINALESRAVETLYENQRSKYKIALVNVPSDGHSIGKTLAQLNGSESSKVANVLRNGSFLTPDESFVFKGGDRVIVTGSSDAVEKLVEKLRNVEVT